MSIRKLPVNVCPRTHCCVLMLLVLMLRSNRSIKLIIENMKRIKQYIMIGATVMVAASCSDFLDTAPNDALSSSTTWKSENDAEKFAVGCYNGWEDGGRILYMDCASDFAYNNFSWEGYKNLGNGTMTQANSGASFYGYGVIRRCNTFLENINNIEFADEAVKKDLIAQVRVLRAYKYFNVSSTNYKSL